MITDLTSFLIISCYTKFRFGERGAQCILGEGGPLSNVLEFLYTLLNLSYSSLNTARSALSCIVMIDKIPVGQHPVVCRFLIGAFEEKPLAHKYYGIEDVNQVLRFLKTLTN